MLHEFTAQSARSNSLSKSLDITPDALEQYLKSKPIVRALGELDDGVYSADATATLYQEVKMVIAESAEGWTTTILTLNAPATAATTLAYHSFMYMVSCAGPVFLDRYDIDGYPETGDVPGTMRARLAETHPLSTGASIDLQPGPHAYLLRGAVQHTKIMRLVGPAVEPVTATFDAQTGDLRSLAYATAEGTSPSFFTKLADALLREGAATIAPTEIDAVIDFFNRRLDEPDLDAFTRWKLIQIMGRHRPASAVAQLERIRDSGPPRLAALAAQALGRR